MHAPLCSSAGTHAAARRHLPDCSRHHRLAPSSSCVTSASSPPRRRLSLTNRMRRPALPFVHGCLGLQSLVGKPMEPMDASYSFCQVGLPSASLLTTTLFMLSVSTQSGMPSSMKPCSMPMKRLSCRAFGKNSLQGVPQWWQAIAKHAIL